MPQSIVHELQPVHVAHDNPDGLGIIGLHSLHFIFKAVPVVNPGQGIVKAEKVQLRLAFLLIRHVPGNDLKAAALSLQRNWHEEVLQMSPIPHILKVDHAFRADGIAPHLQASFRDLLRHELMAVPAFELGLR